MMLRTWSVIRTLFVIGVYTLVVAESPAQQIITVARRGEQALGQAPDVEYSAFFDPVVSNDGIISFHAKVGLASSGLKIEAGYLGQPLSFENFSTQGDSAPSAGAGRTMVAPRILALADGGYGAGNNQIAGPNVGSRPFGLFTGTAGNYVALAAPGMAAPDTGGATFNGGFSGPTINRSGQIAFYGDLAGPQDGVFLITGGVVSKVVLSGETAPVLGIPYFSLNTPAIGQGGHVTYLARTGVSGNLGPIGVFAGQPGAIQYIADGEAPAPGGNPGEKFGTFISRIPAINNLGHVAFSSRLTGNAQVSNFIDEVLWTNMTGSTAILLREGQQAPGMPVGVTIGSVGGQSSGLEPVMNNTGKIAVATPLRGGPDVGAIYVGSPGAMVPVVKTTDPVRGLPPELTVLGYDRPNINDAGQMVLQANLDGPGINQFNFRAIIGYDPIDGLMLIGRGGTPIPGIADIPQEVYLLTGSLAGEVSMTLSGSGMVPFIARFSDGERLLVATIPEPGVFATVTVAIFGLLGARRSRCRHRLPPPSRCARR